MTEPENQTAAFDANDEVSYYYGHLNRDEVKGLLNEAPVGTFLIRDSIQDADQKVLCVKEAPKTINSYKIIHTVKKTEALNLEHVFFILGKEDFIFKSIANILEFYSTHYLNQSPLVKPAFYHKKVIALYDFLDNGDPSEDLYFKEGEILTINEYTQGDEWWTATNESGKKGLVPATLVRRLKPNEWPLTDKLKTLLNESQQVPATDKQVDKENDNEVLNDEEALTCPFKAKVIDNYTPSPYEHSHIALRKGQLVTVLEMKSMGKWFGECLDNGKKGLFPFNRVEILKE